MEGLFHHRIEGLYVGPKISDSALFDFVTQCRQHATGIACVIPNPHQISSAVAALDGSGIGVTGVVAYPLGNLAVEIKQVQVDAALQAGADRLDILMRIESLVEGDYAAARQEALALCELAGLSGVQASMIANLALLDESGRLAAAEIALECGARLKTASGFGVETRLDDVRLLRERYGPDLLITACGNIRLAEAALDLLDAGADRICTPAPFEVLAGLGVLRKHTTQEV